MDPLTSVLLVLSVGLAVLVTMLLRRRPAPAAAPTDITTQVALATQQALTDALGRLSEQSERAREEAIRLATESIARAGGDALGERAKVMDEALRSVRTEVNDRLTELSTQLVALREVSSKQYGSMEQAVGMLAQRTENLNEVLSSSAKRGQWGERLAEDILRAAGFIEGTNYTKQKQIEGRGKPDYRFEMPPDRVLFMDVKFPLDQYMAYLSAEDDGSRAAARKAFLDAVKGHVTALAKRDYVDKAKENTIDYVLMFVPNESISSFVHEADPNLIDEALTKKVVLCTPLNLYAFLVVVRQAADSFHTERNAAEIMKHINLFQKQWADYTKAVEAVEANFKKLTESIESINTGGTRFRKLHKQVREIEKIRSREGVPELTEAEVLELESGDDD